MGRFTIARWLVGIACALALSGTACAGLVHTPPAFAADMVYWGNYDGSTISFAKLDGSGGGDVITTSGDPDGLAIDSATDKIYSVNHFTDKIFFANLDGSGSGSLTTRHTALPHQSVRQHAADQLPDRRWRRRCLGARVQRHERRVPTTVFTPAACRPPRRAVHRTPPARP
jgi:hypothetical protein